MSFPHFFFTGPILNCDFEIDNRATDVASWHDDECDIDRGILSAPLITIPDSIHAFSDDDGLKRVGSCNNVLSLEI